MLISPSLWSPSQAFGAFEVQISRGTKIALIKPVIIVGTVGAFAATFQQVHGHKNDGQLNN